MGIGGRFNTQVLRARDHLPFIAIEPLESRTLFASPAGLDPAFGGGDGFVELPLAQDVALSGAATAPDGKIVVCGYTKPVDSPFSVIPELRHRDFFVARLTPDGALDPTFGPDGTGVVVTDFFSSDSSRPSNDEAFSVLVQGDGKVLVAGSSTGFFGGIVVRYNADGTLDHTWGNHIEPEGISWKIFIPESGGPPTALAAGPDGTTYVGGHGAGEVSFGLARLTPAGVRDLDFARNANGTVPVGQRVYGPGSGGANAMAVLPNGRVLLAGGGHWVTRRERELSGMGLLAYEPDGRFAQGFGYGPSNFGGSVNGPPPRSGGTFLPGRLLGGEALDLVLGSDGKLLAAGMEVSKVKVVGPIDDQRIVPVGFRMWLARFQPDGVPDVSFGKGASVRINPALISTGTDVLPAAGGKIVVAGLTARTAQEAEDNRYGYVVARLTSNGKLDKTFGARGKGGRGVLRLPFAPATDAWADVAGTRSPERTVLATDADGNTLVLAAANSKLYVARLAEGPVPRSEGGRRAAHPLRSPFAGATEATGQHRLISQLNAADRLDEAVEADDVLPWG